MIVNKAIGTPGLPQEPSAASQLEQIQYLFACAASSSRLVGSTAASSTSSTSTRASSASACCAGCAIQLFARVLRFPVPHFRRTSQGELIAMITAEVEPVGGFIGDCLAQSGVPGRHADHQRRLHVGRRIRSSALAAVALYPLQMYLIPKLQRQVNALSKERVRTVRRLSERIGEIVTGIEEVHANDTAEWQRADISALARRRSTGSATTSTARSSSSSFSTTSSASSRPFFFYSIGGYLVIKGDLTFGALVAVLSAYKDMSDPVEGAARLVPAEGGHPGQVRPAGRAVPARPACSTRACRSRPTAMFRISKARWSRPTSPWRTKAASRPSTAVSFQFALDEKVALVGETRLRRRQPRQAHGPPGVADRRAASASASANLASLPQAVTGRRIGYVGQSVALFNGTIRDNLVYGLKHRPVRPDDARRRGQGGAGPVHRRSRRGRQHHERPRRRVDRLRRARVAGSRTTSAERIVEVLADGGVSTTTCLSLGLQGHRCIRSITRAWPSGCSKRGDVLRGAARRAGVPAVWSSRSTAAPTTANMSVAENILFGTPVGPAFDLDHIAENDYVLERPRTGRAQGPLPRDRRRAPRGSWSTCSRGSRAATSSSSASASSARTTCPKYEAAHPPGRRRRLEAVERGRSKPVHGAPVQARSPSATVWA